MFVRREVNRVGEASLFPLSSQESQRVAPEPWEDEAFCLWSCAWSACCPHCPFSPGMRTAWCIC